jgi:hypothetical protein
MLRRLLIGNYGKVVVLQGVQVVPTAPIVSAERVPMTL